MNIAHGSLDLGVAEQFADHGDVQTLSDRSRSIGVTQVMDAHMFELGRLTNSPPRPLQVRPMLFFDFTDNHVVIAIDTREVIQDGYRFG